VTTDTCYYCGGDRRRASHASWCQPAPLSIVVDTAYVDDALVKIRYVMREGLASVVLADVRSATDLQHTWDHLRAPDVTASDTANVLEFMRASDDD
jgi:hypothetical protein